MKQHIIEIKDKNSSKLISTVRVGPQGPQGDQGPAGVGSQWFADDGVPSSELGTNGDFYLNRLNGDVYEKDSNGWTLSLNLSVTGGSGEINQNAFSFISVSGQDTIAADTTTDTLNIVAGDNITITTDAATDTLTINSAGGVVPTNLSEFNNDVGFITQTLSEEQVQDYVGAMLSTNTETLITVSYDDSNGKINFVVDNNLANYDNTISSFLSSGDNISSLTNDSGYITDYTVTESDVTQHQAALTITESQISDLGNYLLTNAVDSVNGQTGIVVLDADDIDDTSTIHKFISATELTKLSNIEENATADQAWGEISGTLSNQTDLQNALNAKANVSHSHTVSDITDFSSSTLTTIQNSLIAGTNIDLSLDSNGSIIIDGPTAADQITIDDSTFSVIMDNGSLQESIKLADTALLNSRSTGIRFGGNITDLGLGVIRISAGAGEILNNSVPNAPQYSPITWTQTDLDLSSVSNQVYYVYIDTEGDVQATTTIPSHSDYRTAIWLARVSIQSNLVLAIDPIPQTNQQIGPQVRDLFDAIGNIKNGLVLSPVNNTLSFSIGAGVIYKAGVSFYSNPLAPHEKVFSENVGVTFKHADRNNVLSTDRTTINVAQYDNNGVLTNVPNNRSTIFTVYLFPGSENVRVLYGQSLYNTNVLALEALRDGKYNPVVPDSYKDASLLGFIIAENDATNLNDGTQIFVTTNRFGGIGGGIYSQGLGNYLLASNNLSDLTDPTQALLNLGLNASADELNYVDGVTSAIQTQLNNKAALAHTHSASDITTGTFDDARISQTNVTQHQAALSITESQISDLGNYALVGANISTFTNDAGYITATLSEEQVQDYVGAMLTTNTETLITVSYDDSNGKINFVVDNNLANYDNTTSAFISSGDNISLLTNDSGYITDYTVTESDVTTALGYTPQDASTAFDGDYNSLTNKPTIPSSTSDITEGTNLYYTDERVDDRVSSLLVAGDNVTLTYDDNANTLTVSSTGGGGAGILSGSGAPDNGLGEDGAFYIDTLNYNIYGPKAAGVWGSPTSMIGPAGSNGVDASANIGSPVSETGTNWTLTDATHANKITHATNSSPISVTIPLNSTDPIAIGDQFLIKQHGTGQVTLIPESGSVVINTPETLSSRKQHSVMSLIKVGTNEWNLFGDLELE